MNSITKQNQKHKRPRKPRKQTQTLPPTHTTYEDRLTTALQRQKELQKELRQRAKVLNDFRRQHGIKFFQVPEPDMPPRAINLVWTGVKDGRELKVSPNMLRLERLKGCSFLVFHVHFPDGEQFKEYHGRPIYQRQTGFGLHSRPLISYPISLTSSPPV